MTTALVDGDIVAFRVAAASEDTDLEIANLRADKLMGDILFLTDAKDYKVFLTGRNNFRKEIYPEYKANRKDKPKPRHLQDIREFLIHHWFATVTEGCEADDLLGVNQTEDTIICSIDKDLLQIPGQHYNWVKDERTTQTEIGGLRSFYNQLLQGDRGDNVPGITGIGPKKAERFLEGITDEQEMFNTCLKLYNNDLDTMVRNGKLLWIWRELGGIWNPSKLIGQDPLKQEQEVKLDSTMQKEEESTQSTEHIDPEIHGM
jgi:DNA polymerase-1